ncbi:MAG: hypothetical protein IJ302_06145 [Clostridia bacterium]|nr:hypothetical protein [Clostridia bacterium]
MSRYGSSRRRNQNRAAMMIVVISALCMVLLMVLFFSMAMKQTASGDTETTDRTVGTAEEPQTMADSDEAVTAGNFGTAGDVQLPQDSTPPIMTETVQTQPPETAAETTAAPKTPDTIPTVYDETLLAEVALPEGEAPEGYKDKLVFYGDSTTHGMKAYKVFGSRDTEQVWTPTSGTLALFRAATDLVFDPVTDTEMSLADLCAANKPEYLIMTLGVNGVSFMKEDAFKTDYCNLIDIIQKNSPDTKLILQSIYPVARSYASQDSINNKKIQAANQWIVQIAAAYDLPYLNTYSVLVGDDGYLPESYQNGDGMHFNEVGFAAVMDYIVSHPLT